MRPKSNAAELEGDFPAFAKMLKERQQEKGIPDMDGGKNKRKQKDVYSDRILLTDHVGTLGSELSERKIPTPAIQSQVKEVISSVKNSAASCCVPS